MKLLRRHKDQLVYEFSEPEKNLLLAVLDLYPLVPLAHHRLSRAMDDSPKAVANQQLLEESLQADQAETRNWITALITQPGRFKPVKAGLQFTVTRAELETLLQILNDIRIGSWLALGSPEWDTPGNWMLNEETARHGQRLELAGVFEMIFLKTLNGEAVE